MKEGIQCFQCTQMKCLFYKYDAVFNINSEYLKLLIRILQNIRLFKH